MSGGAATGDRRGAAGPGADPGARPAGGRGPGTAAGPASGPGIGLIGGGSLEAPAFLRPHPGAPAVFSRRAERFAALAPGHAAGDYLHFLSRLAAAQAEAARRLAAAAPGGPRAEAARPAVATPAARLASAAPDARPVAPPLDPDGAWPLGWVAALGVVAAALQGEPAPEVRAALVRLSALQPGGLEALARRAVLGRTTPGEAALAPIVGAALQVAWTAAAAALPAEAVARQPSGCPRCGSAPVAGMVLGDDKLRYLVCGLCATEWHHTRAQCVLCRGSGRLAYHHAEGDPGPAKAETCGACRAYLKLLYVEQAPRLEPMADDVASLHLDLLMAEQGTPRLGWSLYLPPGEAADRA